MGKQPFDVRTSPALRAGAAVIVASFWASPVRAQGAATEAAAGPAAAPQLPTDQEGRLDDASIDRGWLMPTAMTQPAGSIAFRATEILHMGVVYAPTDRLQLSATLLTPVTKDFLLWAMIGGKLRALDVGRFHVAILGDLLFASLQGVDLFDTGITVGRASAWALLGGAAATWCLDESCRSLASAFVYTGYNQYVGSRVWPILYGATLTYGHHVKLLIEADSAALIGDVNMAARGALVTYGVRVTYRNLSGDFGFTRPFASDVDLGWKLGLPVLALTYRAL